MNKLKNEYVSSFVFWLLVDVAGLVLLIISGAYLVMGRSVLINGFPSSSTQAMLAAGGGLAMIVVAAIKLLTLVMRLKQRTASPE